MLELSVVITAHKDRGYLDECIKSIINNGFDKPYEIILASDGNKELEKFTKGYSKEIRFACTEAKSNLANNYNNAVKIAEGKYLKIIADDDILVEGCLKKMYDTIEKGFDVVFGDYKHINNDGTLSEYITPVDKYMSVKSLILDRKISGAGTMYSKRLFDEVGGFCNRFNISENYILNLKFVNKGYINFEYIPEFIFMYRHHDNQKSLNLSEEEKQKREQEMERINKEYNV